MINSSMDYMSLLCFFLCNLSSKAKPNRSSTQTNLSLHLSFVPAFSALRAFWNLHASLVELAFFLFALLDIFWPLFIELSAVGEAQSCKQAYNLRYKSPSFTRAFTVICSKRLNHQCRAYSSKPLLYF